MKTAEDTSAFRRSLKTVGLQGDRFGRALADASAAIDAGPGVNLGLAVIHRNRFDRAGTDASFATHTLFGINLGSHFLFSLLLFW